MLNSSIAKEVARFIAGFSYEDLPRSVVAKAKTHILDTLGVTLAGSSTEVGKMVSRFVKKLGGSQESTLFGYGGKVPSINAVFANSAMAHSIEADDLHNDATLHVGGIVVPSVLAVAEEARAGGRDVIVATVLGYEVMARVGRAINSSFAYFRGYHPSSICGPFGAAAAVGKILHLDVGKMTHALGLAGIQSTGPMIGSGSLGWYIEFAKSAQAGTLSALLASEGFTGPFTIFEDKNGFCNLFSDKPEPSKLTQSLGRSFEILRTSIKPYTCCRFAQPGIDALLEIMKEHAIDHREIAQIVLRVPSPGVMIMNKPDYPKSFNEALSNGPYIIAVAAIEKGALMKEFLDEKRSQASIQALSRKVRLESDPELDKVYPERYPAAIEVQTVDGKKYSRRVDLPKGDPENPLTKEELEAKFVTLASYAINKTKAKEIIVLVDKLDELKDVRELTELLVPDSNH